MALVVNTNVSSIASQRHLMETRRDLETAMERLSSGKRINSSSDDAAGLAIATRMDSQVRGLNMAIRNANDGISVVQSAEGAMQQITEMLQRMRELAVQSTSGANNAIDRASLDQEVQQLKAEIDRIANSTTFNSKNLLDGSFSSKIQVGYELGDTLDINIGSVDTGTLGIGAGSSSSGGGTVVSGRVNFSTSTVIQSGDIVLNGVALGGFNGASTDTTDIGTTNNNIADFVDLVNNADAGVTATAFNRVVASNVGTGIIGANELAIKVGAVGTSPAQEAVIGASNSMEEMVSNINLAMGGSVIASVDDGGRLVLSNNTGASISIADSSSTVAGATDAGTGFTVEVEATTDINQFQTELAAGGAITNPINYSANEFNGFIQLSSTNGQDITLTRGNTGLTSPGTLDDLAAAGFREINESPDGQPYTTTGIALTSAGVAGVIAKGDITLNGVEIYEATLSNDSDSFQGKLDLINAFQTETGVIASAYFEKTFDFSNVTFVSGINFDLNGTAIAMSATLASTVANINAATSAHGLQATINGQNVKLVGNNVQHLQIDNFLYDIDDDFEAEIQAMADKTDVQNTARTVTFANLNYTAGLTLTMTFGTGGIINNAGGGGAQLLTGTGRVVSYTVQSGDTQLDIAEGFRAAINTHILNGDSKLTSASAAGLSVGKFISAYAATPLADATMYFRSAFSMGSAVLQFSVTLPTTGNKAFSAVASNFGAIRLTSLNDTPIQIDLGSGSAVAEHGLLEMNVGAADYDNIDPSMGTTVLVSGLSVSTQSGAESALTVLDQAIVQVGINRASLGAIENRLDHTVSNLANVVENTEAAKSRIQDADFAYESAQLARAQILQQAGTAMLAQANAAPQNVLSLLG